METPTFIPLLAVGFTFLIYTAVAVGTAAASSGQPDDACIAPLESLLDCLPYAQGKAPSPTPSCCTNVNKVFQTDKKCLCELIAASFQGGTSSGLPPFNRTLALHMPTTCNVPADPAKCPGLLGIPASSPEAKEFTSAALKPAGSGSASRSPSSSGTGSNSGTSSNPSATTASDMRSSGAALPHFSTSSLPTMLALSLLHLLSLYTPQT